MSRSCGTETLPWPAHLKLHLAVMGLEACGIRFRILIGESIGGDSVRKVKTVEELVQDLVRAQRNRFGHVAFRRDNCLLCAYFMRPPTARTAKAKGLPKPKALSPQPSLSRARQAKPWTSLKVSSLTPKV